MIKVEALAEAFNDVINPNTGVLSLDIGVFFIVKCECVVQLLIPSYGYCPVPPEQVNPAVQNCKTFNDRTRRLSRRSSSRIRNGIRWIKEVNKP